MGQAYTPGLKVTTDTLLKQRRVLPLRGEVMVQANTTVGAQDVVARAELPGDIMPINMANRLSVPPGDVRSLLQVEKGMQITKGDVLAETKGIFGLMKSKVLSDHSGVVESISDTTGQLILRGPSTPVEVLAYLPGKVVEVLDGEGVVIENQVALIQGIFGIGGEAFGPICMATSSHEEALEPSHITENMRGAIVVGGARVSHAAVQRAIEVGVAGIVAGGVDDADLKAMLGYDLGVAITGSERIGLTVVITEGFGEIAMSERTFRILQQREGRQASVNGATQIRAGVMRPEIVIPVEANDTADDADSQWEAGQLAIGRPLRVIRDPWFGRIGTVSSLPAEPAVLDSGSRTRVLEVDFGNGEKAIVPRANVELIEA